MITRTDVVVATGMPAAPALNWGAIIAGGIVAAVATLILMLIGSGFGFTMVSPDLLKALGHDLSRVGPRFGSDSQWPLLLLALYRRRLGAMSRSIPMKSLPDSHPLLTWAIATWSS